jgi:hypothetical protein
MSGPRGVPWSSLPPEEAERYRKDNRRRRKLRQLGRPSIVPNEPTRERIILLHDVFGLTFRDIAKAVPEGMKPLSASTVSDLYRGRRASGPIGEIPRTTEERVLAIPIPDRPLSSKANVNPVGTQRRLRALAYAGYGSQFISELLGYSNWNFVWRITAEKPSRVHRCTAVFASTRDAIAQLYEELIDTDPLELGLKPMSIGKTKATARRKGYEPASCWDEGTIDDPNAIPEWTGACGTVHGRAVHQREGIPICRACADAWNERRAELERYTFDGKKFEEIMKRRGLGRTEVATALGINTDTVYAYVAGIRRPPPERADQIATFLRVSMEELS